MLEKLQSKRYFQMFIALVIGFCFGFLLQKSGVTRYEILMGQLLLDDWTVVKVMLSAILTGMIGIYLLRIPGLAKIHPASGSVGATVIGGLIFGGGLGILGYCPGTMAGAAAQGSLDALVGGVPGIILGAAVFANMYPRLKPGVLKLKEFEKETVPQLFSTGPWPVIAVFAAVILGFFVLLELSARSG